MPFKASALSLVLATILTACASTEERFTIPSEATVPESPLTYQQKIERFSAGEAEYAGFYNNFAYRATFLNTYTRNALLERQSEYYQWDPTKLADEKAKSEQEMNSETVVFLSFYTPDRQNDNLAHDKSIWRVYLEVGGRRYQAKLKRLRGNLAELQALYPYHTRWNSAYLASFPISTGAIESQPSKLTVTGPLGTKDVSFSAL